VNRYYKVFASLVAIGSLSLSAAAVTGNVQAAGNTDTGYQSNAEQRVNPDFQTMNRLLTEAALKYQVPPEIVKAIAENESGDWKQFDESGEAIVTSDNGIGIMQITNQAGYDEERLKNDIQYNIEAGVQILNKMFDRTDLPAINRKERDVLEHWYFAIMAYNGIKPVNSPIVQETGLPNPNAYQEKIYKVIEKYGLVNTTQLPFKSSDFQYDSQSTKNIEFVTKNYSFNLPFTKSKHSFNAGQKVEIITSNVKLRSRATTDGDYVTLKEGEALTVTGPFVYDEVTTRKNHFVWYPVKRSDGSTGYVASSYLRLKFHDVPAGHYAEEAIDYLVDRGILYGVGNDNFGMGQPLKRWQAVLLLTRSNNVSLDSRENPNFTDVPTDYPYYKEIAAAVDEGLFGGVSQTQFDPEGTLTRAQMAVVLQRLYEFPEASGQHPFKDIKADWYADAVARLYSAGITGGVTLDEYGPDQTVTREQFAVFMQRSMDESFRIK